MITDLGHPAFAAHDVDETNGFYGMLGIEPGQERTIYVTNEGRAPKAENIKVRWR
jgi:hypothetical protein